VGEGELWLEQVIAQLCQAGIAGLAADLGAMVIAVEQRNRILCNLITIGHLDDAINVGFEKKAIFAKMVGDEKMEYATQMLIDTHFEMFVDLIEAHEDFETAETMKAVLVEQGRTLEARKVARRFAARARPGK
jgi:hypothetical protein